MSRRPCVLVFAGLDPSGGAGLTADLQAVAGQGAHALTVATALTVQDNDRVYAVQPVEPALLLQQAQALLDKMTIVAVKIGITGSAANAQVIASLIRRVRQHQPALPVVLDPVLASGHGDLLSRDDAVLALAPLLPLATVITPNGPEAAALSGANQPGAQAQALHAAGCRHVLITGGHGSGETVDNLWFNDGSGQALRTWRWPRLAGAFHGSGCTLASAIAGQLALTSQAELDTGHDTVLDTAFDLAQQYCERALRSAYSVAAGQRIPQRLALT